MNISVTYDETDVAKALGKSLSSYLLPLFVVVHKQ